MPFQPRPTRLLRRAVLDRRYAVLYEVRDTELVSCTLTQPTSNWTRWSYPAPSSRFKQLAVWPGLRFFCHEKWLG